MELENRIEPSGRPALGWRDVGGIIAATAATIVAVFASFTWLEHVIPMAESRSSAFHLVRGIVACGVAAFVASLASWKAWRKQIDEAHEELTRARADVAESRALADALLDCTPAGLYLLDKEARIVRANRMMARLHGAENVIGQRCQDACSRGVEACSLCPVPEVLATGQYIPSGGKASTTTTGEIVLREAFPVHLGANRDYALVVEEVITEQQKLHANLLHQEKMAAFGLLAAGVAHDMGNPLSSVEMHLELLHDEGLPNEAMSSLAIVRQEVARLRRTLRDLVDFARKRRNEATLVSVQSVVEDTLKLLRYDHRMRGVQQEVVADPEAPAVHMVEDHLMQVVLNLALNALDAMQTGGKLTIDLRTIGDHVALRVFDTGHGMPPSVLARCFEPQFTTKGPGRGTGLGLSISKEIIEGAGGRIELHSAVGQGTTAIVTLPAVRSEDVRQDLRLGRADLRALTGS